MPRAPHNSTQYIIDEHLNSSPSGNALYYLGLQDKSFYSPEQSPASSDSNSPMSSSLELVDFPEMPSEEDIVSNSALERLNYMTNDFDNVFQKAHQENLVLLSRQELIEQIVNLEDKLKVLEAHVDPIC